MKKKGSLIKKLLIGFGILFLIGIIVDSGDSTNIVDSGGNTNIGDSGNNVSTIESEESSASQATLEKESIDGSTLIKKEGIAYAPDSDKPFSGTVVYATSAMRGKIFYTYKDGGKNGLYIYYHVNGQKREKGIMKGWGNRWENDYMA